MMSSRFDGYRCVECKLPFMHRIDVVEDDGEWVCVGCYNRDIEEDDL